MTLSSGYHPVGAAEHRAWFDSVQQRTDVSIFGIRLAESDELIGSCQLSSIHHTYRSAELQIRIGPPDRRGQGLGREAIDLLLQYAFDDLNLHRVQLHVLATNTVAIRLYRDIGFVTEGTLRDAAYVGGAYVDIVVMSLLEVERGTPVGHP